MVRLAWGDLGDNNPGQPRSQSATRTSSDLTVQNRVLHTKRNHTLDIPATIRRLLRIISHHKESVIRIAHRPRNVILRAFTLNKPNKRALRRQQVPNLILSRIRQPVLVKETNHSDSALIVRSTKRHRVTARAKRRIIDSVRTSRRNPVIRLEDLARNIDTRLKFSHR